ncbi:MAG: AMP-binding protein, partial [Bacteroidia bacterium]|nr:AMP-binding protein [Bacteroidia bacterium]
MVKLHLSQQEIYFDQVLDPKNSQYNIGTYIIIKGDLEVESFKRAVLSVQDVFDVFKSGKFAEDNPVVHLKSDFSSIDITELTLNENWSEAQIKQLLRERINLPFEIHAGKLYDFTLIKREKREHWFYIGCHHLFSDGYGVPYVLLSYIFDKYHSLRIGDEKDFHYPPYFPLAEKSTEYLISSNYDLDRNYWKERFAESYSPIIQKKNESTSFQTDSIQLFFNLDEQKILRSFCINHEISLQDFLIAVLTVYYKTTNNINVFDFCLPIHNRNDRKERQTLGVFSKFMPCRIDAGNLKLIELFKIIKQNQRQDYRHKQFPVSHFNSMIKDDINNSSSPFDICVNYRYFKLNTSETELDLKGFRNDSSFSKTPIEYSWCDFAEKGKENLYLEITFREDYFSKTEIELLSKRISLIIGQFYYTPDEYIDTYEVVPKTEKKLLRAFNDTKVDFPRDKTFVDLFSAQVKQTPDRVALAFEEKELTYIQLDELSNQLAHYLQKNYDIKPDDLIGIKQERSEWMIISILGIL